MAIPVIAIPLNKIYKLSADQQQDPELIKNWCEKVILPEVLLTALELYLVREGIKNIDSLHDTCNALTDPSLVLVFTPVNHQHRHLTPAEVHKCINVVSALETDVSEEAHCTLGVCFAGLTSWELAHLMQSIQSLSSNLACSDASVRSTWSSIANLLVGHQSTDVAWQSQDSPVPSNTDNHPVPVSAEATPSSTIAAHTGGLPTDDETSPLPSRGLQNVFAETVLSGSDEEDEEVKFSCRTEPLQCPLPPQASSHGSCFLHYLVTSLVSLETFFMMWVPISRQE